MSYTSFKR